MFANLDAAVLGIVEPLVWLITLTFLGLESDVPAVSFVGNICVLGIVELWFS